MMSYTHSAFAILLFIIVGGVFGIQPTLFLLAVASLASLLPDIDHPRSILGMLLFPISNLIYKNYGHRTITHSFWFIFIVGLLTSPFLWINWQIWFAIIVGVISHLVGDGFTVSGVPLQYPNTRPFYFLPEKMLFKTGSPTEIMVLFIFIFLVGTFGGVVFIGFRSVIHNLMPSFDGTIAEYSKDCDGTGDKRICNIEAYTCGEYCGSVSGMILGMYNRKLIVYDNATERYFELEKAVTIKTKLMKTSDVFIESRRIEFRNSNFELEEFEGIVTLNARLKGTFNCLDSSQVFPVFYVDSDNMNIHSFRFEDLKSKSCIGFVKEGVIDYKIRK